MTTKTKAAGQTKGNTEEALRLAGIRPKDERKQSAVARANMSGSADTPPTFFEDENGRPVGVLENERRRIQWFEDRGLQDPARA